MTLAERLAQIEAAAWQPGGLALRTVEQMTSDQPDLLRALMCAAIPHAWDTALLARMLDPDLASSAGEYHDRLIALPVVEPYLSRPGWHNVHEVTRLALREKLFAEGRLPALSARAFDVMGLANSEEPPFVTIERLYHQLLASPEAGAGELEKQWQTWQDAGRWSELLNLAAMLEELLPHLAPEARARALLRRAAIRTDRRPLPEVASQVKESADLFLQLNHKAGYGQALDLCGYVAQAQGDLAGALRYFNESKAISERLAASDPANASWQRELASSLSKLGDVAKAQGDLAGALRYFNESKAISERLAASDPANASWQRELAVSLSKLGDVAKAQGDLAGALRYFNEFKAISERLAASDPANASWQRELAVSLSKLGDVAQAQGDLAGALRYFNECKAISERLAASDPANASWQRELAVSLSKLGDVAKAQGDLAGALRYFNEFKAISERLAASDPANASWQRELAVSLSKLGDVAQAQGDLAGALRYFNECKAISERLAASDPANASWQRALGVSLSKLGDVAQAQGDLAGALRYFNEDKAISERLAASDPANASWQRGLWIACLKLADLCLENKQAARARNHRLQAHEIFSSMKKQGMHLSPRDQEVFEWLSKKLSKK